MSEYINYEIRSIIILLRFIVRWEETLSRSESTIRNIYASLFRNDVKILKNI